MTEQVLPWPDEDSPLLPVLRNLASACVRTSRMAALTKQVWILEICRELDGAARTVIDIDPRERVRLWLAGEYERMKADPTLTGQRTTVQ